MLVVLRERVCTIAELGAIHPDARMMREIANETSLET
jgi:hypothetical protein